MKEITYRKLTRYKYQTLSLYQIKTDVRSGQKKTVFTAGGWIALGHSGTMNIKADYCWDGASGPTIDTKTSMRASLVHDALYQLMREGLVDDDCREVADDLFEKLCIEDGMNRFRAWYYRQGLRFAGFAATRNDGPEIVRITAP